MSIYSSVFSYRPRADRLPTEDFLTAALADLLNRLPRDEHVLFVCEVLLGQSVASQDCRSLLAKQPKAKLRWKTQQAATDGTRKGIADLVLLVGGLEAIVVENKVAASIRSHGLEPSGMPITPDEEGMVRQERLTQLTTYGRWLAARRDDQPWRGALVFLTHLTEPPFNFGAQAQHAVHTSVCRWHSIWRWASDVAARQGESETERPAWMQLAAEFAEFLERLGMTGSGMTLNDASNIGALVELRGRTDRTFAIVTGRLSSLAAELGSTGISGVTNTDSMSSLWSWFYLKPRSLGWFIGWGLRTQGRNSHWSEFESLPSGPHAFVLIGTDKLPIPIASLGDEPIPEGWTKLNTELAAIRGLPSFREDGEGFSEDLAHWIAAEISAIRPTIARLTNLQSS